MWCSAEKRPTLIYVVQKRSEKESTTMTVFVENLLHEGLELTKVVPNLHKLIHFEFVIRFRGQKVTNHCWKMT